RQAAHPAILAAAGGRVPALDRRGRGADHPRMEPHPDFARLDAEAWRARDLASVWHPCTQMKEHPGTLPLVPIRRGRGAWLEGVDGKRYLDAVSSWWTNLFGHAEPRIAEAIAAQARELEHVIFAGFSHEIGRASCREGGSVSGGGGA